MYNLDMMKVILDEGIEAVLESNAEPLEKLQQIVNLTGSFIAIVKDLRFIHALRKEE